MSESSQGFCVWLLQVAVLLGLLLFFLWLALRPLDPTYTVVEFSLPGSAGAAANATEAAPLLALEISNDNKGGAVLYDDVAITLYVDGRGVGGATIPSFYQPHGRTTAWRGGLGALRRSWSPVVRGVAGGAAKLRVGLVTAVRFRLWQWRSRAHRMEMEAALPVGANGRIVGNGRVQLHRTHSRRRWWWLP